MTSLLFCLRSLAWFSACWETTVSVTIKFLKIRTPEKIAEITLKFEKGESKSPKTQSDESKRCRLKENSVYPDYTAPLGAV